MGKMRRCCDSPAQQGQRHVYGCKNFTPEEPDEVVWLRDMDGTGSMHVCAPHDPGAIPYYREV